MKAISILLVLIFIGTFSIKSRGQDPIAPQNRNTQTVRGSIFDRSSSLPVANAKIELLNYSPIIRTIAGIDGNFVLESVPVGRHRFWISADNYEGYLLSDVVVTAGKEVILDIPITEYIPTQKTLKKPLDRKKDKTIYAQNEMALAGTQAFTIEEVSRYSGALRDPARLAASSAGIYNYNDIQNDVIVRGNTSFGVKWQVEDVPIRNPHHFALLGTTGGSFSLLNSSMMANSDFLLSAYPAEYGNATSGIFDIRLRNGNNQRFEFALGASLFGGKVMAEGPIKKGRSSFAIHYGYSLFELLVALGANIGSAATPNYQDLNFKLNFKLKKRSSLSFFGIGGIGNADLLNADIDPDDPFSERNRNIYISSWQGLIGMNYKHFISKKTYLKWTFSHSSRHYHSNRDSIAGDSSVWPFMQSKEFYHIPRINLLVNTKVNARALVRWGMRQSVEYVYLQDGFVDRDWGLQYHANNYIWHSEAYAQFQYKLSRKFVFNIGIYGQYFSLNERSWAVEPRFSLGWFIDNRQTLRFGYGMHSVLTPFAMAFYVEKQENENSYNLNNRNLGLLRNHQATLSYDLLLGKHLFMKLEAYAQYLYDIPINKNAATSFSLINAGTDVFFPFETDLTNAGIAYNYGTEFTLRRDFHKGFYGSLAGTYFRSLYQGSDQQLRSTAYDILYMAKFTAGKEFRIGRRRNNMLTIDTRWVYQGGRPYTPILLEESITAGTEIRDVGNAYSARSKPYLRLDLKLGARFNGRKKNISHYIYLDAINIGNFWNESFISYNNDLQKIVQSYQFGLVPLFFYELQF